MNKDTHGKGIKRGGKEKCTRTNGETISEGKGSRVKRTRNTLAERRAREPTLLYNDA